MFRAPSRQASTNSAPRTVAGATTANVAEQDTEQQRHTATDAIAPKLFPRGSRRTTTRWTEPRRPGQTADARAVAHRRTSTPAPTPGRFRSDSSPRPRPRGPQQPELPRSQVAVASLGRRLPARGRTLRPIMNAADEPIARLAHSLSSRTPQRSPAAPRFEGRPTANMFQARATPAPLHAEHEDHRRERIAHGGSSGDAPSSNNSDKPLPALSGSQGPRSGTRTRPAAGRRERARAPAARSRRGSGWRNEPPTRYSYQMRAKQGSFHAEDHAGARLGVEVGRFRPAPRRDQQRPRRPLQSAMRPPRHHQSPHDPGARPS